MRLEIRGHRFEYVGEGIDLWRCSRCGERKYPLPAPTNAEEAQRTADAVAVELDECPGQNTP